MNYRVRGVDRQTGEARTFDCVADSEDGALEIAAERGVAVSDIDRLIDPVLRPADPVAQQRRTEQTSERLMRREREGGGYTFALGYRVFGALLLLVALGCLAGSCAIANDNTGLADQVHALVYGVAGVGFMVWAVGVGLGGWAFQLVNELRRVIDRMDHPDEFRPRGGGGGQ